MTFQKTSHYCNYFSAKYVASSEEENKLQQGLMGNVLTLVEICFFKQDLVITLTDGFLPFHTFEKENQPFL